MNARFVGPLIVVTDVARSKQFYEGLLHQKLRFDLGACQQYESGLTLQARHSMSGLYGFSLHDITLESKSVVLYFEVEDFEAAVSQILSSGITLVHNVVTFAWGQRSIALYDPDGHVIDVSESMAGVVRRFAADGMSAEDIAYRTEHPLDFVQACLGG